MAITKTVHEWWDQQALPNWLPNQAAFEKFLALHGSRQKVLNCSVTPDRARQLVDSKMPEGWDPAKCLRAAGGKVEPGLENWSYEPIIRPQPQLPYFKDLPQEYQQLTKSPWAQYPSRTVGIRCNSRLLRYNHQLWQDLKPKTLRGVTTTLVLVTPQIASSYALTPHINLEGSFLTLASLSREGGPLQMMPAGYLYPDSKLADPHMPAAMFADILPQVGGDAKPVLEAETNPWGEIARYDRRNYYYGFPLWALENSTEDITRDNLIRGGTILPNGKSIQASRSQSFVYATLDPSLQENLAMSLEQFQVRHALRRGTVTHDGLPVQLPPEMQACVYAICLTAWELEMKEPGNLESYTLRTSHAAIRSYHYYQQMEPGYSNFMRMIREIGKEPSFRTYLMANHLNHAWLGGNLRTSNQPSESERSLGAQAMRSYYHQQLDWQMGVHNLWNQVAFRKGGNHEGRLPADGVAMHFMQNTALRHDTNLFYRPIRRLSEWPGMRPDWIRYDTQNDRLTLPVPAPER